MPGSGAPFSPPWCLHPAPCGGPATIKPLTPLSNVTPDMLNPDGTFKKNGLAPVDPAEQF